MDLNVHIFLDNEHHISSIFNLQAEAEQLLKRLGNSEPFDGTGYHAYERRRDWRLVNIDETGRAAIEKLLKTQGVKYNIEIESDDNNDQKC